MKEISNEELREYLRKYNFRSLCKNYPEINMLVDYVDKTEYRSKPHSNKVIGSCSRVSFKKVLEGKVSSIVKVEKRYWEDREKGVISIHLSSPVTGQSVLTVTDCDVVTVGYSPQADGSRKWEPCFFRGRDFLDINNATDLELEMMRLSNSSTVRCIAKRRDVEYLVISKLDLENMRCMSFIEDGKIVHGRFCFETGKFVRDKKYYDMIR